GCIPHGVERQLDGVVADLGDAHFVCIDAPHGCTIAGAGDRVSEDVEANADVADGSRSERTGFLHTRAPSDAATRSKSANAPAAVTSGPAPGPCTTSGLSQ